MPITFCPIASGSSGNCTYLAADDTHVLIDAGISCKRVEVGLRELGAEASQLSAIFVTHEHIDHISGLGAVARRYKLPVYATANTWRYFERYNKLGNMPKDCARTLFPGERVSLGGLEVQAFNIPHDCAQPVGYCFYAQGHKIFVGTDIGSVTDEIRRSVEESSIVLLESNHDLEMLANGPYPRYLKDRVAGSRGHLSNASAGRLLADTASERLRYVYLGHMSKENNMPMIAMDTVRGILESAATRMRADTEISIAERDFPSKAVSLP